MVDTIESFVAKLQEDGVRAGQAKAQQLQSEAEDQSRQITDDAQGQADKIIADAEKQAANILARTKTEMELAARDTVGRLRETLSNILNAILAEGARGTLSDVDFLGKTLHEIIMLYTKADHEHQSIIRINVPEDVRDDLKKWALAVLGKKAAEGVHPTIDLKGRLKQAGFEYEVDGGGTVEITLDSVTQALSELVTPALREVLAQSAKKT